MPVEMAAARRLQTAIESAEALATILRALHQIVGAEGSVESSGILRAAHEPHECGGSSGNPDAVHDAPPSVDSKRAPVCGGKTPSRWAANRLLGCMTRYNPTYE